MVEAAKRYYSSGTGSPSPALTAEMPVTPKIEAWFDGACEPYNPGGHGTFGIVVKVDGKTVVARSGYAGVGSSMSNNVAEFAGFMAVLAEVSKLQGDAVIYGDSNLVINTLKGAWKAKKGLYVPHFLQAKALLESARGPISLKWVPREENEECDVLSKDELRKRGIRLGLH